MPDLACGTLFSPVVNRVIAIANDGVQKRAQDSYSALNERAAEPKSSTRSTGLTSEGGGNRDGVIDLIG
jgi:hypothetical protein